MLRKEFGNLLGNVRVSVVTVSAVNLSTRLATINFAVSDPSQPQSDPQDVPWIGGYVPAAGELAYLAKIEGSPVLIGSIASGPLGHVDFYTTGATAAIASTAFTSLGGTATTPSFTKLKDGTRLKIDLRCACFVTVGGTQVEWAVRVNSVDYGPAAGVFVNPAGQHTAMSGIAYADGVPAGSYTGLLRARQVSGTGVVSVNTGDPIWLTIDEVWA